MTKPRTLEEIQDWLDGKDIEHGMDEPWYRAECDKCLAAALREAADAARQEQEHEIEIRQQILNEIAEALTGIPCLHGVVDGTPGMMWREAILCAIEAARREEREECIEVVRLEAASWPELGAALLFKVQGLLDARSRAEEPKKP